MSPLVKSTILSLGLLAGAAASAYAQSENIAKLPPAAAVTPPPAAAAPSTVFLGPDPGTAWPAGQSNTGTFQTSPQQFGAIPRNGVGNDFE